MDGQCRTLVGSWGRRKPKCRGYRWAVRMMALSGQVIPYNADARTYSKTIEWCCPGTVDTWALSDWTKNSRRTLVVPLPFVLCWAQVAQRGMAPLPVVEPLDVFEDR